MASPLNLWFSQLNWVVSPEAIQEVDRKEAREKASLPHRFSTTVGVERRGMVEGHATAALCAPQAAT